MSDVLVHERPGALRFAVRVQPRASRTEFAGVHAGALKVRVHAPPVDGAANDALVAFLADALGIGKQRVRIIHGAGARMKTIEVQGVDRQQLKRLIPSP
jgi:uncharacterized protein (TIGR00251 family)